MIKAKIQAAMDFLEKKNFKGLNKDGFQSNGVSYATDYRILKLSNPHTLKNDLTRKKTRGWKRVVIADQIREIEEILQQKGLKIMRSWELLGIEAGVEVLGCILKRVIGRFEYHKCLACQRNWQSPQSAAYQVKYIWKMLKKYLRQKDWDQV